MRRSNRPSCGTRQSSSTTLQANGTIVERNKSNPCSSTIKRTICLAARREFRPTSTLVQSTTHRRGNLLIRVSPASYETRSSREREGEREELDLHPINDSFPATVFAKILARGHAGISTIREFYVVQDRKAVRASANSGSPRRNRFSQIGSAPVRYEYSHFTGYYRSLADKRLTDGGPRLFARPSGVVRIRLKSKQFRRLYNDIRDGG